jgi:hypothetical protein
MVLILPVVMQVATMLSFDKKTKKVSQNEETIKSMHLLVLSSKTQIATKPYYPFILTSYLV